MTQTLHTPDFYQEALKERFGPQNKRYLHSLGVAETASYLAEKHNLDPQAASIAGLLHDWEKNKTVEEVLKAARAEGLEKLLKTQPAPVLHGPLAAHTLPKRFPELTPNILRAIAKHTTGARQMSPLDKVIFIADAIEPHRLNTPSIAHIRELAETASLDELYEEAFVTSIQYVLQKRQVLSLKSVELYNQLVQEQIKA